MDPNSLCRCQLRFDTGVLKINAVVSRDSLLVCMRELRSVAGRGIRLGLRIELEIVGRWYQQNIEHIDASGATQVSVAEAQNRIIGVVISRTMVPVLDAGVRTQLHRAKRHCCAWI